MYHQISWWLYFQSLTLAKSRLLYTHCCFLYLNSYYLLPLEIELLWRKWTNPNFTFQCFGGIGHYLLHILLYLAYYRSYLVLEQIESFGSLYWRAQDLYDSYAYRVFFVVGFIVLFGQFLKLNRKIRSNTSCSEHRLMILFVFIVYLHYQ